MRSRFSALLLVCALLLLAGFCSTALPLAMASGADADATDSKIAADLRAAMAADADSTLRADVMVQLESPQQALDRACNASAGGDRAQRATCVASSLQQFADAAQESVKAVLAQHPDEFERSEFFWINNSAAVKKATGALVQRLARLESVVAIRSELIFHTQGGALTERPFSASNLLATVANARFKSFQVQHDVLGKNPVLAAIAREIPWKNLFDLFTLKFFAAGDELLAQGSHAHELVFVLCGGFLARRLSSESDESPPPPPALQTHSALGSVQRKPERVAIAERVFKPGSDLLVYPMARNAPLPYSVLAAKFKSIALTLPIGKFRSIWRQISPETREAIEQLAREAERALVLALGAAIAAAMHPTPLESHKHGIRHSASTPVVTDATVAWSTLQTTRPAEYMVNSSLLILHERPATTGTLSAAPSVSNLSAGRPGGKAMSVKATASAVISAKAKKHTQRRLQSIKMPSAVDAFPRRQCAGVDLGDLGDEDEGEEGEGEGKEGDAAGFRHWESLSLDAIEQLIGKQAVSGGGSRALDVVPRIRVGRLLKPLKKPTMLFDGDTDGKDGKDSDGDKARSMRDRRVLVANRSEPFRDEAYQFE